MREEESRLTRERMRDVGVRGVSRGKVSVNSCLCGNGEVVAVLSTRAIRGTGLDAMSIQEIGVGEEHSSRLWMPADSRLLIRKR